MLDFTWLKHAFAIEPAGALAPTERQRELVDRLCRAVVSRGLATPALLFLETVRPLNFITAQTLEFFGPMISTVGDRAATDELVAFLEHRGSIDYVCRRLEEIEREAASRAPNDSKLT